MTDDKTATHEQVRKEFEKITLVPDDVEFSAEYLAYVWINFPAVTAPFNDMWASFYDGWQAAKERYGQSWLSVYESEPPQGVRALFMERGTEHVICSFPHRRLWEEQGHDLWMPIPATKEQKHEQ